MLLASKWCQSRVEMVMVSISKWCHLKTYGAESIIIRSHLAEYSYISHKLKAQLTSQCNIMLLNRNLLLQGCKTCVFWQKKVIKKLQKPLQSCLKLSRVLIKTKVL